MEAVSLLCDRHVLTTGSDFMTQETIDDLQEVRHSFQSAFTKKGTSSRRWMHTRGVQVLPNSHSRVCFPCYT